MSEKHEDIVEERLFYVFVDLETEPPTTYIVPSRIVAEVITRSHQLWLDTPGRGGRAHRQSAFRRLRRDYSPLDVPGYRDAWLEQYRERWELLNAAVSGS